MRACIAVLVALILLAGPAAAWAEQITRISVAPDGAQASDMSQEAAISADGSTIGFLTFAPNVMPPGWLGNNWSCRYDRLTGALSWPAPPVEADLEWMAQAPNFSADGRYLAFFAGGFWDYKKIYVYDQQTGESTCISVAMEGAAPNAECFYPRQSADGRYVTFQSGATNFVPGLTPSEITVYIYLYDRTDGTIRLVSRGLDGATPNGYSEAAHPSADGRFVVFQSEASNLVPGDTNGHQDIFMCDLSTMALERVNVAWDGGQANADSEYPAISADGRYVSFSSSATNLQQTPTSGSQVWVRDRQLNSTTRVSVGLAGVGGGGFWAWAMSGNGRCVVFSDTSGGLVPEVPGPDGWRHLYLRDLVKERTVLVDADSDWTPGHGGIFAWDWYDVSADGRYVVFASDAGSLVAEDTNGKYDVFLVDRQLFTDVPVDQWAYYEIRDSVRRGIVKGYGDGSYAPKQVITRGQMAAFLARAMCEGEEHVPTGPATPTFTDVSPDYGFYKHIEYAHAHGVVMGYSYDNTYRPGEPVTRGQMAAFLARALCGGEDLVPEYTGEPSFADVGADSKSFRHIEYIYGAGITTGYKSDGLYHPEYTCPRDQMAVFVARAFDLATTAP